MRLPFYFLLTLITASLWFALRAADRCAPLPPPQTIRAADSCGCSIQQAEEPDTYWYVRVWTHSPDGARWEKLYSARAPDELRKALSDCDKWLECIRKAQTRLQKGKDRE